ncbi:hypothetical protein [Nonomuraea salmonea]|uniref:hypothetical protein n=1 Tax=Nonomuraea salmonea TaxID=46181 RepID=UPI0031EACD4B
MRWHKRLFVAGVAGVLALTASACAGGQVRGAGGTPEPRASTGAPAGGQVNDSTFVYAPPTTTWSPTGTPRPPTPTRSSRCPTSTRA